MKKRFSNSGNGNGHKSYCGNCGKIGHIYRRCTEPIISLGIIAFKYIEPKNDEENINFLMIQRRDTLGFVEFMRGKYNLDNISYLYKIYEIMTESERLRIIKNNFETLWNTLWMNKNNRQYHNEYDNSRKKFNKLKDGIIINNQKIDLKWIHENIKCTYQSPEWGFPKGRRNLHEKDIDCAKREFQEESGFKETDYSIIDTETVLEEIFLGTNNIRYKHIYYIAECNKIDNELLVDKTNFTQVSEVSNIKWFNFEEALDNIRPYNMEKKDILKQAAQIIKGIKII